MMTSKSTDQCVGEVQQTPLWLMLLESMIAIYFGAMFVSNQGRPTHFTAVGQSTVTCIAKWEKTALVIDEKGKERLIFTDSSRMAPIEIGDRYRVSITIGPKGVFTLSSFIKA